MADFGFARVLEDDAGALSSSVITRWYRPPELFFGSRHYTGVVDIWSAGCVFAELFLKRPLFKGESDLDQLCKIFEILGTPTEEIWPGVSSLPTYIEFARMESVDMQTLLPSASRSALDLLLRMLTPCPERRITAEEALAHSFFVEEPLPTPPTQLPRPLSSERKKNERLVGAGSIRPSGEPVTRSIFFQERGCDPLPVPVRDPGSLAPLEGGASGSLDIYVPSGSVDSAGTAISSSTSSLSTTTTQVDREGAGATAGASATRSRVRPGEGRKLEFF